MDAFLVCDRTEKYPERQKVLERLLHCIWSEQLFRRTLKVDGKRLQISSPGWWNLEAGPDFRNAEIYIDGRRLCGDVEIHLSAGDWYQHGHHQDTRYNDVVLHVVLYASHYICEKQNGEPVPQLEMKDYLMEELQLLQQRIPVEAYPFGAGTNVRLCRKFIEEHDPDSIAKILDSAGDLRMKKKKERYLDTLRTAGFEESFYQGMMEGMGYKQSRFAFRELAKRIPLRDLMELDLPNRRGIDVMASVLLGTAGLLQDVSQMKMSANDAETTTYVDELFRYWEKHRERFGQRKLLGFSWYPSSTRPANFPARRLTAVAAFFHYHHANLLPLLLQPLDATERNARKVYGSWIELMTRPLHIYWSYHFLFERRKFVAPKKLIGVDRARILTVNVIIPALLAVAELQGNADLERALYPLYADHPRLTDNSITRLMEHRLFGDKKNARIFISNARRQQALHHFFYDFCDNRETCCSRCELQPSPAKKRTKAR